jgi:hypothetical protein
MRRLERESSALWKALRISETLKYAFNVKSQNVFFSSFLMSCNSLKDNVSIRIAYFNKLKLYSVHRVYWCVS